MNDITVGYALCGSFCTFRKSIDQMKCLIEQGYRVLPVMSQNAYTCLLYTSWKDDLCGTYFYGSAGGYLYGKPGGDKDIGEYCLSGFCSAR